MTPVTDAERSLRVARIAGGLGTIGLAVDAFVGTPTGPATTHLFATLVCGLLWMLTCAERRPPVKIGSVT